MTKYAPLIAAACLDLWIGLAAAQERATGSNELGARQLFFLNVEKQPQAKTNAKRPTSPSKQARTTPRETPAATDPRRHSTAPANPTVVNAAETKPMIGLRYSLLQVNANNSGSEVPTDTVFRSGDRVRVKLEANRPGYLYVVQQGSSGRSNLLYPTPDMQPVAVEAMQPVTIPSGDNVFEFDEKPGTEQLFIVLSSQPEETLEELLRSVRPRKAKEPDQLARTRAPEFVADDFRSVREQLVSRDLKVEKVSGSSGAGAENAVYVVAPAEGSRVSTPLELEHR